MRKQDISGCVHIFSCGNNLVVFIGNYLSSHFRLDLKLLRVIPVWLRNRLISAGLEPVPSHTEKACIASYYRQFSTKDHKTGLNLIVFNFNISGKLSIIRCD